VEMRIGKTRANEMSSKVDDPGVSAGEFPHLHVAADGDEAITCHSERLYQAVARISGENFAVDVDGISGRRLSPYGRRYRAMNKLKMPHWHASLLPIITATFSLF
jgi:hypothetical protein